MQKIPKRVYTLEFKEQAVKRVQSGRSIASVAREMGLVEQTVRNWVRRSEAGKLESSAGKAVTPEEMELSRLRAEVAELREENTIPAKSDGVLREGCAVKYAWIDAHRGAHGLRRLCALLGVSASGYRAWQRGSQRQGLSDAQLTLLLQAIHAETGGAYGSPRIVRALRARGLSASKARVERLMRAHGLRGRHRRRYRVTTDSSHRLPVAENLLARDFRPSAPNQVWSADITYLWTDEGWLYLAVVLDLFNREVVGWSMRARMDAELVISALDMAHARRRPPPGLLHHSDRGSQYASHAFQQRLRRYAMRCSMSRRGNCWDNAPTESWFNSFKHERVFGERFPTREAMRATAFEYIEVFYNRKRLHSTLGYRSPVEFMQQWEARQRRDQTVA
ncbi:IS3 family transposase [Marichromatium sp. PS1]|uniref:IS3 family transposase n=1 Tax=Marichromatium sp. PS1 TaxID=3138932 RepID=UPI0034E84819